MRSLDAICETFAAGAIEQGTPDAVLDAIEHDPTARERLLLLLLLLRTWLPGWSRSTVATGSSSTATSASSAAARLPPTTRASR